MVMNKARIAKMANKVAQKETEDEALALVDQAIDTIIASAQIIDANLPKIKTDSVPQKAAVDAVRDLMDTAIAPYLADIAKAMQVFPD
jgi:predicted RNase H-like HicB family nuclease